MIPNELKSRSFLMFTRGIEKKYWLEMIKQTFSHHCIYKTKNYMSNN